METGQDRLIRLAMQAAGKKGAASRVANTTPEQRTAWAKKAGRARQRQRRKAEREAKARKKRGGNSL